MPELQKNQSISIYGLTETRINKGFLNYFKNNMKNEWWC
jgi:hypothetical protein